MLLPKIPDGARLLEQGELLLHGDFYWSTAGQWEPCPCPGLRAPERDLCLWIRPKEVDREIRSVAGEPKAE